MGKKGHKKKFTPFAEHEKKNEVNKTSSDVRQHSASYSGNTFSSTSSSGWSTKNFNPPRESTGNWRSESTDFTQRRDSTNFTQGRDSTNFTQGRDSTNFTHKRYSTDFTNRRDSNDLSHRNDRNDWSKRDTFSRNRTSEGTAGAKNEDPNDSILENSEQEVPASNTSIPWCDQVGSYEPTSIDADVSNLSVEDAGELMPTRQANSSWSASNTGYGKGPSNTHTSPGGDWRSRTSEGHNEKNQRYKNENSNENIERNWRLRDNTGRSSDNYKDRARASRTDVHQTTEDTSKTYETERRLNTSRDSPKEDPKTSPGNYHRRKVFYDNSDEEKRRFVSYLDSIEADNFTKVLEEERDLFGVGKDYALAHCVAEDMNMGSGIAVEFRVRYKKVHELLNQYARTGGLALLKNEEQFIYYLVTKAISKGKPSYDTLWSSLIELRTHMKTNGVKKLAMPRIGCGLDRLDWNIVKPMLEFLFRDEDFDILVCNLQVEASNTPHVKKCKIVYETKAITEIEPQTIIIYFASKDGQPTDTMTNLDKKFFFASHFQRAPKNVGEAIRLVPSNIKNYILYGCIVKNTNDDPFDFVAFDKCLRTIKKNYKTDNLFYVAFQKLPDEGMNAKILNLMKNVLTEIEIYVCGCSETLSNIEE